MQNSKPLSEYLRKGCKECKRRKIKCDEFIDPPSDATPCINSQGLLLCWQCTRLGKICMYPKKGERVPRVSRMEMMKLSEKNDDLNSSKVKADQLHAPLIASPHPNDTYFEASPWLNEMAPHRVPMMGPLTGRSRSMPQIPTAVPLYPPFTLNKFYMSSQRGISDQTSPTLTYPQNGGAFRDLTKPNFELDETATLAPANNFQPLAFSPDELSGLKKDFSSMLTAETKLENSSHALGLHPDPESDLKPTRLWLMISIPRHATLDGLSIGDPREQFYLEQFYLDFANIILPFHLYDPDAQLRFNPARDILLGCAQVEPFLLAAIISQGARSCFSNTALAEHEEAHLYYLQKCLALLGPAIANASGKDAPSLSVNIETVLLTVLLLASSNAANPKQNWRPHLKGAKDLLLKYSEIPSAISQSKILVFCKYWFILFEVLAGVGLRLGGTLKLERELDLFLDCKDGNELRILEEIGVLQPNGFNLLLGYSNDCVALFRDIIKLMQKIREDPTYKKTDTFEYLRLLATLHTHMQNVFVDQQGVFKADLERPIVFNSNPLLDQMPGSPDKFISWMDISHQSYVLAAIITMLTEFFGFLPVSSHVQMVATQLIKLLDHATIASRGTNEKYLVLMLQWPALVAGLNRCHAHDNAVVGDLFRAAARIGAGSANHTLARLERFWISGNMVETGHELADVVNY